MSKKTVHVWQEAESLGKVLPSDVPFTIVNALEDVPSGQPVVVPYRAWNSFYEAASAAGHTRLPPTILLSPPDTPEPEDTWSFADDIVHENEGEKLRQYLEHPVLLRLRALASEMPRKMLDRWSSPIARYRLRSFASEAGLDRATLREIRRDEQVLAAFNEALDEERTLMWAYRTPTTDELADFVQGLIPGAEPFISAYLERSAAGRAKVALLKDRLLRPVAVIPLASEKLGQLKAALEVLGAQPERQAEQVRQALRAILDALLPDDLQLALRYSYAGSADRGTEDTRTKEEHRQDLIDAFLDNTVIDLASPDDPADVSIKVNGSTDALLVEKVQLFEGTRREKMFYAIEIQNEDGETIWETTSERGKAQISFNTLYEALSQEAHHIQVRAS